MEPQQGRLTRFDRPRLIVRMSIMDVDKSVVIYGVEMKPSEGVAEVCE